MIVDDTESATRKYWIAQNPRYATTMYDPDFIAEQVTKMFVSPREDSYLSLIHI